MLKLIRAEQLRPGMHLHKLCGPWIRHPFWRTSFLLDDPADVRKIVDASIEEVWIDTARGHDVELQEASDEKTQDEVHAEVAAAGPAATPDEPLPGLASATDPADEQVPFGDELARAAKICDTSRAAITDMFQQARMGRAIDAEQADALVGEISASVMRNPGALISLARLKTADDYTFMHSVAVCALMISLARRLGLDARAVREAGLAGMLHDVGKMAIPLEILNKPGKLTDAEFETVRTHPVAGASLLRSGGGVSDITLDVCLHHHEKIDGSGYPEQLTGERISLYAKMGAVCDVYDAITSNRPYKAGWDPSEALRKMAEWNKGHFDEKVFNAFVRSVGIYPVGSLVRLQSGHLGVIVEQSESSYTSPKVKLFFAIDSKTRIPPQIVDLSDPRSGEKIAAREDPAKWAFKDLDALWQKAS